MFYLNGEIVNDVNPAVFTGHGLAIQPAAQHVESHHRADLLTHLHAVAVGRELHPQRVGAVRRGKRKVQVIALLTTHRQRQTGKVFFAPFRRPARRLRQGLLLRRNDFAGQQRGIDP